MTWEFALEKMILIGMSGSVSGVAAASVSYRVNNKVMTVGSAIAICKTAAASTNWLLHFLAINHPRAAARE